VDAEAHGRHTNSAIKQMQKRLERAAGIRK
jgi:hypothetical protein